MAALTRGAPWLEQPTTPTTVLWLTEEPDGDFTKRLALFGADLTRVIHVRLPLADPKELQTAIADTRPGLVIIDSLIRYAGAAITAAADSAQWSRVLTPLATLAHAPDGPAILVIHHATKKPDGGYRDSTEIGAVCDMLVQIPRGIEGKRQTINWIGRVHGVAPGTVTVGFSGTGHQLYVAKDTLSNPKHREALATLRGLAAVDPVSSKTWEDATGLAHGTFIRYRNALVKAGHVIRDDADEYRPR